MYDKIKDFLIENEGLYFILSFILLFLIIAEGFLVIDFLDALK